MIEKYWFKIIFENWDVAYLPFEFEGSMMDKWQARDLLQCYNQQEVRIVDVLYEDKRICLSAIFDMACGGFYE